MPERAKPDLLDPRDLPQRFASVEALEEFMTRPGRDLVADLGRVPGDILILGVAGKMGPTLARLAKRAVPDRRVIGVARFSEAGLAEKLRGWGVETIACDLLEPDQVAALPRAANVIYMAGRKFGSTGAEHLTWVMNAMVPATVGEAFRESRIVAFSTGCVYPFVRVVEGGATEDVPAIPPGGDYAWSCVARERVFEHLSRKHGTPGRLIRLNYAIDMRYGVLHDVAVKVRDGRPIDLSTGHVNVIWQGDANAQALRCLAHATTPTSPLNITGPETVSVCALAHAFGRHFGKEPMFTGTEALTGWLNNAGQAQALFGYPVVPLQRMIDWTAEWIAAGGESLGKETHYDARDGRF